MYPCIKCDRITSLEKLGVYFDALPIVGHIKFLIIILVGLQKQSDIICFDLIQWISDICIYSVGLLNEPIKSDMDLRHDVESRDIGCNPTNKSHIEYA
jgi:hypothetical protein